MDANFKRYVISKLNDFLRTANFDKKTYEDLKGYLLRKFDTYTEDDEFKQSCLKKIEDIEKITYKTAHQKIKDGDPVKVIFRQFQSPGDILTLTTGVRDLKKQFPHIQIKVVTSVPAIWEHNPYVSDFKDEEAELDLILEYPLINKSNECGKHFIYGFKEDIERKLQITYDIQKFSCDVHVSSQEAGWINQVEEVFGYKGKFWLINSGTKNDYPLKQWHHEKWQEVVNKLKDRITFVQVGANEHNHKDLDGVLNLVGKTDMRQLIRLAYHAEGALTHVSMLLHLMSAWGKPCVAVAGGRESAQWESYNDTIYLDTVGQLPCCLHGACWKGRKGECVHMVGDYPKCMDLITSDDVVRSVERYYNGGRLSYGKLG
jgi:ADP-heptose:LPS heptosyltransferase